MRIIRRALLPLGAAAKGERAVPGSIAPTRLPAPCMARLSPDLQALLARLSALQAEAAALGLDVSDRPLIACPACGLMEDIVIGGARITTWPDPLGVDTGLRFSYTPQTADCPACQTRIPLALF